MEKLKAIYDGRNSFYGKAKTFYEGNKLILRSYETDVAYIEDGQAVVKGSHSQTTTRHIKEFLKQEGFKAETTAQILKDYPHTEEPKKEESGLKSHIKSVNMVCSMGKLLCKSPEEKNNWDKKMINTLPGVSFPDDFDNLPEKEKRRRLDGALGTLK